MLENLTDVPDGIDGVRAVGNVSRADYERVFQPILDSARRDGRGIRLLYELGHDFKGLSVGGAWQDAKLGLRYFGVLEACAVVTDLASIREAAALAGFLLPCPVRSFHVDERAQAVEWLRQPRPPAMVHRLLADSGVIVIAVAAALRAQDFDAVALTADAWIAAHGDLQGLVIHTREFPGWENFGALVRHLQFARAHHRKIRRVALATDATLANATAQLGEHFLQAAIKSFKFEELSHAIAWAAGIVDH